MEGFEKFKIGLFSDLAHFTAVLHEHRDRGQTYKNVDDPLNLWPAAEQKTNDVPVLAEETADTDKSPVNGSNPHKPESGHVNGASLRSAHHNDERK